MLKHLTLFTMGLLFSAACFSADECTFMRDASTVITNLSHALKLVKARTHQPVFFPKKVPQKNNSPHFYADTDFSAMPAGIIYRINIDATKKCHGENVCNLGFVMANKKGEIAKSTDAQNNIITVPIPLAHHIQGFYTPEHVAGGFFPSTIQWKYHHIAYTIAWDTNRKGMISLANAAILAGPR